MKWVLIISSFAAVVSLCLAYIANQKRLDYWHNVAETALREGNHEKLLYALASVVLSKPIPRDGDL